MISLFSVGINFVLHTLQISQHDFFGASLTEISDFHPEKVNSANKRVTVIS